MADEEKKEKKIDKGLIAEGCKAYGIDDAYVLASRIDPATGEAVILTRGGSRVRYAKGAEVTPLGEIAITGVNPAAKKKKPVVGRKKD